MRSVIPLALAAALVSAPAAAQNHDRPVPLVTVSGEGTVRVAPDLAELHAGVTNQAKTAREAAEANAKAMTALIDAVKEAGISEKDIQTSRFAVQPVYAPPPQNRSEAPRITGYQVTNRVTVRLHDVNAAGDLLDRLIAAGGNDIWSINFLVSDPSKALDEARAAALADAKRKAEVYAQAAGVGLGRVFAIVEGGTSAPMPMMRANMAKAEATPIQPGEETLRVNVTVSYDLVR